MRAFTSLLPLLLCSFPLAAQLTTEQRAHEFQSLAATLAMNYAGANWRLDAQGINIFELKPWMERVRTAGSDLEYLEICTEFFASLRDGRTAFLTPSDFVADLGITADLYGDRVLIESIDRGRYPQARFPFSAGDELVMIDGRPVNEIMAALARQIGAGTDGARRRRAAAALTFRRQEDFPRAVELPDVSAVAVRRATTGAVESYSLIWAKDGLPFREFPKAPIPRTAKAEARPATPGVRTPRYDPPAGFQQRRGRAITDNFFSGTYQSGGKRIGLLRIPDFSPASPPAALNELASEVNFFRANTDALILDLTGNPGELQQTPIGSSIALDYAQRLFPAQFSTFGAHHRPVPIVLGGAGNLANNARATRAEAWIVSLWEAALADLLAAARESRGLTGTLQLRYPVVSSSFPFPSFSQSPARANDGSPLAYDKPLVVLVDELSADMAEVFAAMVQDNRRGIIIGTRTAGEAAGFSEEGTGQYSEATVRVGITLLTRMATAKADGLPATTYIDSTGVLPDVALNFMTPENLAGRGRPYMDAVTAIVLAEIAKN